MKVYVVMGSGDDLVDPTWVDKIFTSKEKADAHEKEQNAVIRSSSRGKHFWVDEWEVEE